MLRALALGLLALPTCAQICNNRDPESGGYFLPALGHGTAMATLGNSTRVVFCIRNASDLGGGFEYGCVPPENDPQNGLAVLYVFILLYCFLGISVVADGFMSGIMVIISATKLVQVRDPATGERRQHDVRVWNNTVAGLTLMALGTSAPEIMLSVLEILLGDFFSGELGPGTIVGSAAFNLLVITAVCLVSIPAANAATGEKGTRRVEDYAVFMTTTFFALFAYAWLVVVLVFITPDKLDLWEALVTFALYFIMVIVAYRCTY
jgi:Ca2+/Na+ antiporter